MQFCLDDMITNCIGKVYQNYNINHLQPFDNPTPGCSGVSSAPKIQVVQKISYNKTSYSSVTNRSIDDVNMSVAVQTDDVLSDLSGNYNYSSFSSVVLFINMVHVFSLWMSLSPGS